MTEKPITWVERVANLTKALGRQPSMAELLEVATIHQMTPEERQAQAESFARGDEADRRSALRLTNHLPQGRWAQRRMSPMGRKRKLEDASDGAGLTGPDRRQKLTPSLFSRNR